MSFLDVASEFLEAEEIEEEGTFYDGRNFEGVTIRSSSFRSVSFSSASFLNASISDTVFESCDFSNADFSSSSMHRVSFRECRLTGAVFLSSRLKHLEIINSASRYSSFDNAYIDDCHFSDSDFPDSSFSGIRHKAFSITSCNLAVCIFRGTSLQNLCLSNSKVGRTSFSENLRELRGANLDLEQSLDIIRSLGVNIIP